MFTEVVFFVCVCFYLYGLHTVETSEKFGEEMSSLVKLLTTPKQPQRDKNASQGTVFCNQWIHL